MNGRNALAKSFQGGAGAHMAAAAVFAALLSLVGTTATAQTVTGSSFRVNSQNVAVGFVPGQTLRVSVSNPDEAAQSGESKPIQIKVGLLNNRGELLYETAEADIPAGGFHSFDIKREDLAAAGDPRTGRLEVRVGLVIKAAHGREGSENSHGGTATVTQGVLQLIDNDTGKTAIARRLNPSGAHVNIALKGPSVGFVPGQTLRVTVLDPGRPGEGGESSRGHVKVFDAAGALLYETAEADIPAGGFHSFDIRRGDIPLAGEPRTGRLQVRVEVVIRGAPAPAPRSNLSPVVLNPHEVLEVIDNDSGKTTVALLLPAVRAAREAARRN